MSATLTRNGATYGYAELRGNIVMITAAFAANSGTYATGTWATIGTLPEWMRPQREWRAPCNYGPNLDQTTAIRVMEDGQVQAYYRANTAVSYLTFGFSFPAA